MWYQGYSNNPKIPKLTFAIKTNGIHIPTIRINSWRAVYSTKIEFMDMDKVTIQAEVEKKKEIVKMKADKMINFICSNFNETEKDKKD